MRFTRQLLERESSRARIGTLVSWMAAGAGLCVFFSCSSSDDAPEIVDAADAATDANTLIEDGGTTRDASPVDAAGFDAAPRAVVCASPSCATALVTTVGTTDSDRAEGYCARLDDGTVACWGANQAGQLGRGDDAGTTDSPTPARVIGVSDVAVLEHTCALDKNGAIRCWGTGPYLRDEWTPTTTERTAVTLDIPPARSIGVGASTACATVGDDVLCWGANTSGQVAPPDSAPLSANLAPRSVKLRPGAPVRKLVVGRASFAFREDGTIVSWGANPPLARTSSLFPDPYPESMTLGGLGMMDVAVDNACAVAGGTGYCWGASLPQPEPPGFHLPTGPNFDRALPEPIVTPEPIVQIATTRMVTTDDLGVDLVQPQRWCACGASGAVYCAGYNASGQAGDGTKNYAYQAVKVVGLPAPAVEVKTMPDSTCALLTTGRVFCWGADTYGQLGTGKFKVPSLVPQEVVLP